MTQPHRNLLISLVAGLSLLAAGEGGATTPADLEAAYRLQSGSPAVPGQGQRLFTSDHGREWRCASCHGGAPTRPGQHAVTGKMIAAMAPATNPERFTDAAKSEKWFRRNCNDVLGRECTAGEKADVIAWLRTLTP